MESVYVVRLKEGDLLLLAEIGLDEGDNVTFDNQGRQKTLPRKVFTEPAWEMDIDSEELADVQRAAYAAYWVRRDFAANQKNEASQFLVCAKRHPFRHGIERRGGEFLDKDSYELGHLVSVLQEWLEKAVDEDVVGRIGSFGRAIWLRSFVPELDAGTLIEFGIHSDTRAWGVARFLAFVLRCGGAANVRIYRNGGEIVLVSGDRKQTFSSVPYFYWSPSH